MKKILNGDSKICGWFVDNKLSIRFGDNKTKSILFASKRRAKNIGKLNVKIKRNKYKQQAQVKYLGCALEESMPVNLWH